MACGSCRKPRPIKYPSSGTPSGKKITINNSNVVKTTAGSGDQRSRITGLTYVPK